jgi:hypothetical protein
VPFASIYYYWDDVVLRSEGTSAMPATYTHFRDDFLVALARKTNQRGRNFFDYDEVADEAGLSRNKGWTEMAASEFRDMRYVNDASSRTRYRGTLNGLGMQEAERLMGAAEKAVELDHGAPEYQRATSALDAVTKAVLQSNDYASSEPEDRDQRVAELEAGNRLLKAPRVRITALVGVLLSALTYLTTKFADAAIGEAASEAVAALKALIDTLGLL